MTPQGSRLRRVSRAARVDWWLAPPPRVWIAVLFVMLALVGGYAYYATSNQSYRSCVIQARGLPAGHHLAAAFQDINLLLQGPQKQTIPPKIRLVLDDLRYQAGAYARIEAQQPQSRSC